MRCYTKMGCYYFSKLLIMQFAISFGTTQDTFKHNNMLYGSDITGNCDTAVLITYSETIRRLEHSIYHLQNSLSRLMTKVETLEDCCSLSISKPKNCLDIKHQGYHESGIYTIVIPNFEDGIRVYCDMSSDRGGWTVIQKREDGSINFNRTWIEYSHGFGILIGEHWLGNEIIHAMTSSSLAYDLRIDIQDWEKEKRFSTYSNFRVANQTNKYQLTIGSYIDGTAGDAIGRTGGQNGSNFSTYDYDNDNLSRYNCAEHDNGFWYNDCAYGSLNGPYCFNGMPYGSMIWNVEGNPWHRLHYCFKSIEMKIRPIL